MLYYTTIIYFTKLFYTLHNTICYILIFIRYTVYCIPFTICIRYTTYHVLATYYMLCPIDYVLHSVYYNIYIYIYIYLFIVYHRLYTVCCILYAKYYTLYTVHRTTSCCLVFQCSQGGGFPGCRALESGSFSYIVYSIYR